MTDTDTQAPVPISTVAGFVACAQDRAARDPHPNDVRLMLAFGDTDLDDAEITNLLDALDMARADLGRALAALNGVLNWCDAAAEDDDMRRRAVAGMVRDAMHLGVFA